MIFLKYRSLQILIACLFPNVGGWLCYGILFLKTSAASVNEIGQLELFYAPPVWVILTLWTILYTMMGFASWRVWSRGGGFSGKAKNTLLIYIAKLFLNWMWPLIAFGLDSLLGAIIELSVLLIFVVITGALFLRLDKMAAFLFIPYFGYLSFVFVLCIHTYIINN